jgi:hypothetical protein
MKANLFRSLLVLSALTLATQAQTIRWGSEVELFDRNGVGMTDSFVFELGAFSKDFDPAANPLLTWFDNWHVFDRTTYNKTLEVVTGTANMLSDGSSADFPLALAFNDGKNFEGLDGYIWIRNLENANAHGSEWLVVRASEDWTFPAPVTRPNPDPDCCATELPLEWSVSDLSTLDMPKYGVQAGTDYTKQGPGEVKEFTDHTPSTPGAPYLQSGFAPVPELSSSVLIMILGVLGLADRRRRWRA